MRYLILILLTFCFFSTRALKVKLYFPPGELRHTKKLQRWILNCEDRNDLVRPCYFILDLKPGKYHYFNTLGTDSLVLQVKRDTAYII